jgi:hypothetical protein
MHSKTAFLCLITAGFLSCIPTTHAQLQLNSSDQGHINLGPYGVSHDSTSQNYRAGMDPMTNFIGIPYFVFEIPDLVNSIEAITLSIYNPADAFPELALPQFDQGYMNDEAPSEISLWDYTGNKSMFDTDFNTPFSSPEAGSIWDDDILDLHSGTQYGSRQVDSSNDGSWVDFYLNSDTIIDIWSA